MEASSAGPPRISVAMATCDGERHLEEQLRSLAEQTSPPCELVACDDASSDGTVAVLRRFTDHAPFPVRIHQNQRRLGFRENFLKAARLCGGDWIAFSDQDDVWLPHKLRLVRDRIQRNSTLVLVAHSGELVSQDLAKYGCRFPDFARDAVKGPLELPLIGTISGFAMVFARALIDQFDPTYRPICSVSLGHQQTHDGWVSFIANAVGTTELLTESLVLHRRHSGAVTGPHQPRALARMMRESMATGASEYRHLERYGKGCAESLRFYATNQPQSRSRLLAGAARYDRFARQMSLRASIHEPARSRRARALARLLIEGAYFGRRRAFGPLALGKDVAVTLSSLAQAR